MKAATMLPLPVHYDCDPGQDDAIALLYALGSGTVDVRSISVAGGNVDVLQCARNAGQILDLAAREDIPVYVGAEKPLRRPLKMLPEVFGETGMAGAEDLPTPKQEPRSIDPANDLPGIAKYGTVVATAPLTNIALALQKRPDFARGIDHLILMGGCVFPEPVHGRIGNLPIEGTDGYAEYNFATDPDAAQIVFKSGIKNITLVGLNVTRSVLYNKDVEARLKACGGRCAVKAAEILSTVGEDDLQDYGALRQTPDDPVRAMHDVLAMAYCDRPEMFTSEILPIDIVAGEPPEVSGQTLISRGREPHHPAVRVVTSVNKDDFLNRMIENIARLP